MFRKSKRFSEISTACESLRNTPLVEVFLAGYEELETQLLPDGRNPSAAASAGAVHSPTLKTINIIQRALSRASSVELTKLERNMSWLATTASVAPSSTLLTVWDHHSVQVSLKGLTLVPSPGIVIR
jgi:biopolymer transport protein TolQ